MRLQYMYWNEDACSTSVRLWPSDWPTRNWSRVTVNMCECLVPLTLLTGQQALPVLIWRHWSQPRRKPSWYRAARQVRTGPGTLRRVALPGVGFAACSISYQKSVPDWWAVADGAPQLVVNHTPAWPVVCVPVWPTVARVALWVSLYFYRYICVLCT